MAFACGPYALRSALQGLPTRQGAEKERNEVSPTHYCEIPPFDEDDDDGKPSS